MAETPVTARDFARRTPLYHPDFPYIVHWSQKAGSTTVVTWFLRSLGLLDDALALHNWVHHYECTVFKARPRYRYDVADAVNRGTPSIKFLRDPYQRLYSLYLDICSPLHLTWKTHWAYRTRLELLRSLTGYDAPLEYTFSFADFVEWLAAHETWGRDILDWTLDVHLAPQLLPFERRVRLKYFNITDFRRVVLDLGERVDRDMSADGIAESWHHHEKEVELSRASKHAILKMGVPLNRAREFRHVSLSMDDLAGHPIDRAIRRLYGEDIQVYERLRD